ncbi:hypothetical protein D3C85_1478980 [compost metagenome]
MDRNQHAKGEIQQDNAFKPEFKTAEEKCGKGADQQRDGYGRKRSNDAVYKISSQIGDSPRFKVVAP